MDISNDHKKIRRLFLLIIFLFLLGTCIFVYRVVYHEEKNRYDQLYFFGYNGYIYSEQRRLVFAVNDSIVYDNVFSEPNGENILLSKINKTDSIMKFYYSENQRDTTFFLNIVNVDSLSISLSPNNNFLIFTEYDVDIWLSE